MKVIISILLSVFTIVSCGDGNNDRGNSRKSRTEAYSKPQHDKNKKSSRQVDSDKGKNSGVKENPIPKNQLNMASELIKSSNTAEVESVDAAKIFKLNCAICHGRKGDLSINGSKILKDSKTTLVERVAQVYYGKGTMTPYKGILNDHEIIAVARYIDELKK